MIYRDSGKKEPWKAIRVEMSLGKDVSAKNDLAEELGKYDEWAVHNLWANRPYYGADLKLWIDSFNKWAASVKQWMENQHCSYLDIKHFFVLGLVSNYQFDEDSEFNWQLNMLNMHRERINNLIYIWTGIRY